MKQITIGIADDHQLFLKSLSLMFSSFNNCEVVIEALNGKELQEKLKIAKILPDIILLDVNMPVQDGITTASWINENYPVIKMVALSMKDDDKSVISMIKAGCCSFLLKDIHPNELEKAIFEINNKGYYNADLSNINYRRLLLTEHSNESLNISEKEKIFLQYACTDMTYKQIASIMNVTTRTVDGYRENLFKKMKVESRVGLAMEAIRKRLVDL